MKKWMQDPVVKSLSPAALQRLIRDLKPISDPALRDALRPAGIDLVVLPFQVEVLVRAPLTFRLTIPITNFGRTTFTAGSVTAYLLTISRDNASPTPSEEGARTLVTYNIPTLRTGERTLVVADVSSTVSVAILENLYLRTWVKLNAIDLRTRRVIEYHDANDRNNTAELSGTELARRLRAAGVPG